VAERGFPSWWLEFWNCVSIGQGACGTALRHGERIIVEDVESSPIFAGSAALKLQRRAGIRGVQSTPIMSRTGHPLGMFSTHYRTPLHLDSRTEELLDLLARHAAHVIELARTERARLQVASALAESEARFSQIADTIEDAFYLYDREEKRFSYISPAMERISGLSISEIYEDATRWYDSIPRDDWERVRAAHERMLKGDHFDEEYRLRRPDGEVRWVRTRSFAGATDGNNIRWVSGLIQDITNERKLAEELRQAQKMEAVGALASGVAHDFNNVLQAILGCVNMVREETELPESARRLLDQAARTARRGGTLAAELMAFAHKRKAEPRPLHVDGLIEEFSDSVQRLVTKSISLKVAAAAPQTAILADPMQIQQILLNLASNARDAMPDGGTLTIRTDVVSRAHIDGRHAAPYEAEHYLRLIIQDTGTGIDEETRERIFEPFFTTKAPGKGTGIGLSTVFAITGQLGGHVNVDSELGSGTTFTLYFPRHEQTFHAPSPRSASPTQLAGSALLVEDDEIVRMTLRHHLEELGLDVLEVAGPDEALGQHAATGGSIDVLISDVNLPLMRGPELAVRLRQDAPKLRVLFISGNPESLGGVAQSLEHTELLQKPFDKDELGVALEKLLLTPNTSAGRSFQVSTAMRRAARPADGSEEPVEASVAPARR
jgi:PAS domain S-box-containing protein